MSEASEAGMAHHGDEDNSTPTFSHHEFTIPHGTQIGPYKLLSVVGEGGFGMVYLAEQQKPVRRQVALSLIGQPSHLSKPMIRLRPIDHSFACAMSNTGLNAFGNRGKSRGLSVHRK